MLTGVIYLITNFVNGKKYIGQTRGKKVETRWTCHIALALRRAVPTSLFHKAIRKYGVHNFSAEVIWTGDVELLDKKETYYIKRHNSFVDDGCGYNLTRGGGVKSKSKLVIAKHRKAASRRWQDPEERSKQSERQKLIWQDPEYRAQASVVQTGRTCSKATRKKISASHKGKKASKETKVKLREAHLRRYAEDPSLRYRVGAGMRGNHASKSEAAKKSMREGAARRWARPEEHKKASIIQKGRVGTPHSAASRAKRSIETKALWQTKEYKAAHRNVGAAVAASNLRRRERKLADAKAAKKKVR